VQDEIELMLQVNGKLRGSIKVPASADKAAIEAAALASARDFAKFSRRQAGEEGDRGARPAGQRGGLTMQPHATPASAGWCWPTAGRHRAGGCGFELRRAPALPFRTMR
jgi:leucyl-tRNA synthetase